MPRSTRRTTPSATTSWQAYSGSRCQSTRADIEAREQRAKKKETGGTMLKLTLALAVLAVTNVLGPARAQDAVDVAKAKAEGKVVWYTSTPIEQGQKIVDAFQKAPGIKVEM